MDTQAKQIPNHAGLADIDLIPSTGRIVSIDPGTVRIGVAVCDELRITSRPHSTLTRTNWKKLLLEVKNIIAEFDAVALVVGLPLASDESESEMSTMARDWVRKFRLSLNVPVFMQDERVTSYEARSRLWKRGASLKETRSLVDSEAASIILSDFLERLK